MSFGDWVALAGVVPLIILGGWVQTFRVWRRQEDVSAGVVWMTGPTSTAGLHGFALPAMSGMTLMWFGVVIDLAQGDQSTSVDASTWLLGIGFLLIMLGFWMWLFAWPRFLVPPHLRGQPGWVAAFWRRWRADRVQARRRRGEPRREGGEHARR